jgi:cell division protein FtsI (penicillin-binding protein 3)
MVSTIANGGVYMPPHILLRSTGPRGDGDEDNGQLKASAFRPENELPAKLPHGAHRVIKELTAAKMRRMMQGIVMEGTGTEAALNGYSAGGKTGTAQKIDVATHTYSKTKYVASFTGMAPVSNPAITVAVVIDSPSAGGSYYGSAVSAPVFHSVAQQVLEYLGVPHDQPLKTTKELQAAAPQHSADDAPSEKVGDLNAMFDQANSLPADDPLRTAFASDASAAHTDAAADAAAPKQAAFAAKSAGVFAGLPAKVLAAFDTGVSSASADGGSGTLPRPPVVAPQTQARPNGSVVVDAGHRVAVPLFTGSALRMVVETASGLGLRVEPVGNGIAQEQVPAAGTMVPLGTEVVVRFAR